MAQAPASAARETYVVGHDGSRRAADALALATWLARARSARVVVVRVIAGRAASAGDGERRAEAAAALRRIVAAVADVPCAARVVDATSAARGLQRVAAAEDAVLLVVGATRRPAGPGEVDGAPEALVRDASVAVAVAPAGWAAAGPREDAPVACAFDDTPEAAGALRTACALAGALRSRLDVLGAADGAEGGSLAAGHRERLHAALARAAEACAPELRPGAVLLEGPARPALVAASDEAVLIVVGARRYGTDPALFGPSISRHLVERAGCPVVVVPLTARAPDGPVLPAAAPAPRGEEHGLLTPEQTSLLVDQYELTMAASYLRRGMDEPAVFELYVRHLPGDRRWLLVAGLGPALALVERMRFGPAELEYLAGLGFGADLLGYLETFRFTGDIHAMPEGTVAFADEPLLRVVAPRIEAQLLETLLLNQVNFQTAIATKAARIALAAGGGHAAGGGRIVDFSPRRDHGVDAAMMAARCAAIAGAAGTSNVAAAMRFGLRPVGTMAHSYVLSFATEEEAFCAFLEDNPDNAVLLVDTYDSVEGVRAAIRASHATGVALQGIRLDSGDLLALSQRARRLLDEAGMRHARILGSGDLEEHEIARLVAAGAPIDTFGVGTDLGTSRDAPAVGGVYKIVADRGRDGRWRPVAKTSPGKATLPWPKQVFRSVRDGRMTADTIARADEPLEGEPLLVAVMEAGTVVHRETVEQIRDRAARSLESLPEHLRRTERSGPDHPVSLSPRIAAERVPR